MKTIRERLEGLESVLSKHSLPESLRIISSELDSLAAYAGVADGVEPSLRQELLWTAGLARDCWQLTESDRRSTDSTSENKAARAWSILGAVLDRTQDLMSADPMTLSDVFLDAMSIILPWVGSTNYIKGTLSTHHGAVAGAQGRLEEVLWHHFLDGRKKMPPGDAWAEGEKKRGVVQRCSDLIFLKTTDPRARAATLLLLYLSVVIARIDAMKETGEEGEPPRTEKG